jgi:hypothetical protein
VAAVKRLSQVFEKTLASVEFALPPVVAIFPPLKDSGRMGSSLSIPA